jgi:hypothetical protein
MQMKISKSAFSVLSVLALGLSLGACAGEEDTGSDEPVISFSADLMPIVMERCGGCHLKDVDGAGKLSFGTTGELTYSAMIDQPTVNVACADLKRIDSTTDDPMRSSLYVKMIGTTCGKQMPAGSTPVLLTEAELELFRLWIVQGAPNN